MLRERGGSGGGGWEEGEGVDTAYGEDVGRCRRGRRGESEEVGQGAGGEDGAFKGGWRDEGGV